MNLVELDHALRKLRLSGMATVLEARLRQAQTEKLAPLDLVATLVNDELQRRQDRLFERRHQQARFRDPERSLDSFDFDFNKKMNRALIHELATARFVGQREDALFLGPPGTGKSHLAQAIGRAAIQQGYRVVYREAHTLMEDIADATLDGTRKAFLADLATVEKQLSKNVKLAKTGGDKEAQRLVAVLEKVQKALDQGLPARTVDLAKEELVVIRPLFLLTMKPTMYVANVDEKGFHHNPLLDAVEAHAKKEGAPVVAICASIESQMADLEDEDKKIFLEDLGLEEPGLNRVIRAGYQLMGLQTYFTAGPKEVRAWTIHVGDTAPKAAGVIHTDFEHGFIRAEVIAYPDFISGKGEHGAKEAGKMRVEGKEYVVHDGDVMHFRFNV